MKKKRPAAKRSAASSRYIEILERDLAFLHSLLDQHRLDIEFYRGKVERLELAIMSQAAIPAQQNYVERSEPRSNILRRATNVLPQVQPRMPFSEVKRRWNQLSEKEQNEAMEKGWNIDAPKEENNAGKQ